MINKNSIITAKTITEVELVVIETSQVSLLFKYGLISKIIEELRLCTLEILQNYGDPIIFENKPVDKEHQSLLLNFGRYLVENKEYKRAKYVFEKFKDLYPNTKFQEEMTECLNELKQNDFDATLENNVYKTGDTIFSQFENDKGILFLKKGKIKVFFYTSEYEYYFGTYNAPVMMGQVFYGSKIRTMSCIAASDDTEILIAPKNSLDKSYKNQNKAFLLTVIKQLCVGVWTGILFFRACLYI